MLRPSVRPSVCPSVRYRTLLPGVAVRRIQCRAGGPDRINGVLHQRSSHVSGTFSPQRRNTDADDRQRRNTDADDRHMITDIQRGDSINEVCLQHRHGSAGILMMMAMIQATEYTTRVRTNGVWQRRNTRHVSIRTTRVMIK